MTTIILFGGNGYIGRELTQQWLARDSAAQFYILSRSGQNTLQAARVHNIAVPVDDFAAVNQVIPAQIDYIVDLVGRPVKDPAQLSAINQQPATVMQQVAETHQAKAMGMIGGRLGPKAFVTMKSTIIQQLQSSSVRLAVVEPTLVYGGDRQDSLAKLIPLFKLLGHFNAKLKPITVTEVAQNLLTQLI